jgi:hypothetical protein
MAQNLSKYIQLNDALLLEYEFNKEETTTDLTSIESIVGISEYGTKEYWNTGGNGITNNSLLFTSVPTDITRSSWYINPLDTSSYLPFFDPAPSTITQLSYVFDTIKVHIVSGYNFDDIAGFLLQIRAEGSTGDLVDLANFTWVKQLLGSDVIKFSSNALYLGNKFYDKYALLRVPSIQYTSGNNTDTLAISLGIKSLSDVYITYSNINDIDVYNYTISDATNVQLPVTSVADNFNAYIAQSSAGDFIEFYATWNDIIIGEYMGDIESGKIALYTSNNPNDNYQEFVSQYGYGTNKWVLMHEIFVYENITGMGGGSSLLTQKYSFTQSDNFSNPNYFRPVLINSDIDSSYVIQYVCRLTNRMDGSQIIRQASFASTDPKKYGRYLTRLNVEDYVPYNIFNKIPSDSGVNLTGSSNIKTKFSKIFIDTTNIVLTSNNEIYPQGTGPLFLKNGDSVYSFHFEKFQITNNVTEQINVDLSGVYNYALLFVLDDGTKISVSPTYSANMNATLGVLEFKLLGSQIDQLLKQKNNNYSIVILNPDGTSYTYYQGLYYPYSNYMIVMANYTSLFNVNSLNSQISTLKQENASLKAKLGTLTH